MERMLHSVLPHEMTHTVFAHHFRYPVPRWADEGGSVLSEDDANAAARPHVPRFPESAPGDSRCAGCSS